MSKVVFITGGARSGKSAFALNEASRLPGTRAFIATMEPLDEEMKARIEAHGKERGTGWDTFEEPVEIAGCLRGLSGYEAVVIDCLTLWLSNLMLAGRDVETEAGHLIKALKDNKEARCAFVVSNEVGMGIVPDNGMARSFRDMAGKLNKLVAQEADEVYLMVSGLHLKIK